MLKLNIDDIPDRLKQIPSPPKQLFALGDTSLLSHKYTLSVVGSRKITTYGNFVTNHLTSEVAAQGVTIVSGLALGVDAAAHRAALEVNGNTIAVLPCGLDAIYPATNRGLAKLILENNGLLISEYSPGTPALVQNFIARNRLVSGLGDGLLVTESGIKSGTIHTANFALEQGKVVMAVPGNINSPASQGTNSLIQTGASPVTSPDDILNALNLEVSNENKQEVFPGNENEKIILEVIQSGTTDSSEILLISKMDSRVFNQTLTMLEITKKIKPVGAGHYTVY